MLKSNHKRNLFTIPITILCSLALLGSSLPSTSSETPKKDAILSREALLATGILNVSIPSRIPFVIDPYEVTNKGKIFSEPYMVTNDGFLAVMVYFNDIRCTVAEGSEAVLSSEPVVDDDKAGKLAHIYLEREGERMVLSDKSTGELSFVLEPGESASFMVGGTVNAIPKGDNWVSNDLRISFTTSFVLIEELEVEIPQG